MSENKKNDFFLTIDSDLNEKLSELDGYKTRNINKALRFWLTDLYVVFVIRKMDKSIAGVGICSSFDITDINWHYVNHLAGPKYMGHHLRQDTPTFYRFEIHGYFPSLIDAKLHRNLQRQVLKRLSYKLVRCYDLSRI